MATLEITGVRFEAGGRAILRDVNLTVAEGETVALLGPSGSGKTTLLRMVAGLDQPSAGSITFDGQDLRGVPAHRRGFGMMFQDHALFPHMDVAANVDFGLKQAGWPAAKREARRSEVLRLVGMEGFERRSIERLSGGERQRIALARTLAPEPKLLMLDEPLGSLDRGLRERLATELREILGALRVPALYVTHDQFEAFTVADRLGIMNEGRIVRTGSPRELWDEPGTEFVARFLGMENILPAATVPGLVEESEATRNGLVLVRAEGALLADNPGPGVVSGTVVSLHFRGASTELRLRVAGTELSFELPSGSDLPAAGAVAHIRPPRVQRVEPGEGALL